MFLNRHCTQRFLLQDLFVPQYYTPNPPLTPSHRGQDLSAAAVGRIDVQKPEVWTVLRVQVITITQRQKTQ